MTSPALLLIRYVSVLFFPLHKLLAFLHYRYAHINMFVFCVYASSVKNGSQLFKVWVPSLADVALVLMNMGVAFVTLFPFENLQPLFTEGDLL